MIVICLLTLLFNFSVYGDDWDPHLELDPTVTFVSLGSHCEIAVQLNENALRKKAYPFDWLMSCNHNQLISLLKNDFAFFLDEQFLFQHPTYNYVIENSKYEIEFRHDWPFSDLVCNDFRLREQLDEMHTKYTRRINRFRSLGGYRGKVFFIRAANDVQNDPNYYWFESMEEKITSDQALELKQTLSDYFPNLNFTLVIVNYVQNRAPSIALDHVLEFKVNKLNKKRDYKRLFDILLKEY